MDPPPREPGALSFGIKSATEIEHEGQTGLLLSGWASRYNEVDVDGEVQQPGSLLDSIDTWLARDKPPVWLEHGMDPAVGPREIGWATKADFNDEGLFVEVFVPRDIWRRWSGPGAKAASQRFKQVYADIKKGVIRGFSVGGHFTRAGKSLLRWAVTELTICRTPCLPSAQFMLGTKALTDEYGSVPTVIDDPTDTDAVSELAEGAQEAAEGGKAAMKSEPDGKHPASHYLFIGDPAKPSTWKLRVKNAAGAYDRDLCGNAHAALTAGFRGNKVTGVPKAQMLAKLKRIYNAQGWEWPEGGSGGKTALPLIYLEETHPQTYAQVASLLLSFTEGRKAGRRFSAETLAAVRRILDQLEALEEDIEQTFGVADADDTAAADADGAGRVPSNPAGVAAVPGIAGIVGGA